MSIKQKEKSIKKNFVFFAIKSAMSVLFPLISFPYASRILGVEGIGNVQYCTSIISYYALFAALGIGTYAIREGVKFRDDRYKFSKFASEILVINSVSTLIVYFVLAGGILGHFFVGHEPVMIVCSLSIFCTTISIEWIYQIREEYVYISIRTIIVQIVALIFLFLLVRNQENVVEYAAVITFASGGYCLFNFIYARKYVDLRLDFNLELKKHLKAVIVIFGNNVASSIYLHLDTVMLGFYYGDYEVGLYSVAMNIMAIMRGIINSISAVVMPRLSYYYETDQKDKYLMLLRKGIHVDMLFSIPCMVGIICLSRSIILLFSGPAYLDAVTACRILAINLVFATLDNVMYCQILIPHHLEKQGCIGTGLGAVLNLLLNSLLIPQFLREGAAVASLLAELIVFIFFLYQLRKLFSFKKLFSETYKLIISALSIVVIVWCVEMLISNLILQIFFSVVISAVIYFGILLLLRYRLVEEEFYQVRGKLIKMFKRN